MLSIRNIVKQYSGHRALSGVSMEIEAGKVFGLLGPNGAGKTSLIRIINQITAPDSGEVLINGEHLNQHHIAQIGYLPEERGLYVKMKVIEMPASEPSRAARGVILRRKGPIKLPPISTKLCTKTQHSPAPQAAIGSPVAILIGSMMTNVTTNICGTETPEGRAQTSVRPVDLASL